MPHFIIDCSEDITSRCGTKPLMEAVFETAKASELFALENIKVRLHSFSDFILGAPGDSFVHVFGHIMQGRTVDQRDALSKSVVIELKRLLPDVEIISMNVSEFEKASYNNLDSI